MLHGGGGSAAVDVVAVARRRLPYQSVTIVSGQTTPAPPADCWDISQVTSHEHMHHITASAITLMANSQPEFQNTGRKSYQAHNIHHLNRNFTYFKNIR